MANSNTRKAQYGRALKALMREKDLDKITISELCRVTNTSRHTFYYHFKDIPELIYWMHCATMDSVIARCDGILGTKATAEFLRSVKAERDYYIKIMDYMGPERLVHSVVRHKTEVFTDMLKRHYHMSEVSAEITPEIHYHLRACAAAFLDWVLDDKGVTEEELVARLQSFLPPYVQEVIRALESAGGRH